MLYTRFDERRFPETTGQFRKFYAQDEIVSVKNVVWIKLVLARGLQQNLNVPKNYSKFLELQQRKTRESFLISLFLI